MGFFVFLFGFFLLVVFLFGSGRQIQKKDWRASRFEMTDTPLSIRKGNGKKKKKNERLIVSGSRTEEDERAL